MLVGVHIQNGNLRQWGRAMRTITFLFALSVFPACYADDDVSDKSGAAEVTQSDALLPMCEKPPFGAKSKDYRETTDHITRRSPIGGIPPEKSKALLLFSYKKACYVKNNGRNLDQFLALGLSGKDIADKSITSLAISYWGKAVNVYIQKYVLDSKDITVRDFVIDGPVLARQNALVDISGWYAAENDNLYSDQNDYFLVKYSGMYRPSVALLLDTASRNLREKLLTCKTDASKQGCQVKIRGVAIICEMTNAYGASHEEPCINAGAEPDEGLSYLPDSF